jgi:hypothetical protein
MTVLALAYMAAVGTWQIVATDFARFEAALIQRIADSVTFGTSAMLLAALCNKPTLVAFGDTRPFLFFAGMTGFIYAVVVARPKR